MTHPTTIPTRRTSSILLLTALSLCASLALSCASYPDAQTQPASGVIQTGRVTAKADVPLPPGVDANLLTPRMGDALARARTPMDQILTTLPMPTFLAPQTQPASQPVSEAPPEAQRRYVRGRQAWRERRGADAINELRAADALYPNSPDVLQLLGQIYTASGNRVRGGFYLEQAVRLNPHDVESLFYLGRFAIDQERSAQAIAIFSNARALKAKLPDTDPAIWPLLEISLAGALDREGYDAAAIEQYQAFLDQPSLLSRTTRLTRELFILSRQRGLIWQAIGDGLNRLGDPASAIGVYEKSSQEGEVDPQGLTARLVYSYLRLAQPDAARNTLLTRIEEQNISSNTLDLVRYLAQHGGGSKQIIDTLKPWYEKKSRPAPLALTLGEVLGGAQGRAFWIDHLAARPQDFGVYERLIDLVFSQKPPSADALNDAIHAAATIINGAPESAARVAAVLTNAAVDQQQLIAAIDAMLPAAERKAGLEFLRGRAFAKANQYPDAIAAWTRAMELEPTFTAPRVDLATVQLAKNELDAASRTLEPVIDSNDADVVILRSRILHTQGDHVAALQLIDKAITRHPLNAELFIQKASLQSQAGDTLSAEQTLLTALDRNPQAEILYEGLFRLYQNPGMRPDTPQRIQNLVRRLIANLPQSRLARLTRAEVLIGEQQLDAAERILRVLIEENDRDIAATEHMLNLLVRTNRRAEADAMIDQLLGEYARDASVLSLGLRYYQNIARDRDKFDATLVSYLQQQPSSPERALNLARLMVRQKQFDRARAEIRSAIEQFPAQEVDLMYFLTVIADREGDRVAAERAMEDILAKHPEHSDSNNGLGYSLAERGVQLDRALKLVQQAVDAEPNNAAYLDSLGWVYYKQGRAAEAVEWLRRATAAPGGDYPVILDHLGDALYRDGKTEDAVATWRRALSLIPGIDAEEDREMAGIDERLNKKVNAVSNQQPVPVAALGEGIATKPAP